VVTLLFVCSLPPIVIEKPLLLNVSARFCASFIGLARCVLGNWEAANCAVHLVRRGSGNSARLRRIRAVTRDSDRTESAEGVVSPVVGWCEYLGKLELDKWTLPHAVEILATTVL